MVAVLVLSLLSLLVHPLGLENSSNGKIRIAYSIWFSIGSGSICFPKFDWV